MLILSILISSHLNEILILILRVIQGLKTTSWMKKFVSPHLFDLCFLAELVSSDSCLIFECLGAIWKWTWWVVSFELSFPLSIGRDPNVSAYSNSKSCDPLSSFFSIGCGKGKIVLSSLSELAGEFTSAVWLEEFPFWRDISPLPFTISSTSLPSLVRAPPDNIPARLRDKPGEVFSLPPGGRWEEDSVRGVHWILTIRWVSAIARESSLCFIISSLLVLPASSSVFRREPLTD